MARTPNTERRNGEKERENEQRFDRHAERVEHSTEAQDELVDKLVYVNRVAKTVKGGRRMAFAALVVVGDKNGRVGFASGKAREVPEAIRKATDKAKRDMIRVALKENRTLHHDVCGRFGAGSVILRTAPAGTGIIAGGPLRAVFEALGVQDIVAKSTGSQNPHNMIKATLVALKALNAPRLVAAKRSKKVAEINAQVHSGEKAVAEKE
ncbi:MAG: 30S ribosomal protein S5 [Alphaproteobacteria bacterium]|nr:30S ribosomal protein S5 [Alphaproteobacteria bacterium]